MERTSNAGFSYCNVVGQTDVGKKRKVNEDHGDHFETLNGLVSVVCDGMGGHVGGAVASEIAIRTIHDFLDSQFIQDPREAIGLAIDAANKAIVKQAEQNPDLEGMGSTCVLLIVRDGKVYIGHVGDSRIYLIREKTIVQLTKDHSFVQSLVDIGQITKEQAEHHPRKNEITNALGLPEMAPATVREEAIEPQAGDCFLLCSDGLSGMVSEHDIEKIVSRQRDYSTQQRADLLVQAANNNGGLDNITVELVEFTIAPEVAHPIKSSSSRILKVTIPVVCALVAVALGILLLKPNKHETIQAALPDLEKASIIQITKTSKKNEYCVRVLPQAKDFTIVDKISLGAIETNLDSRDINDGIELFVSDTFDSDSAFVMIPGQKSNYKYFAKVNNATSSKTVVLSEVVFRSMAKIGTIYKDSHSIQISIDGSGTTTSVDDVLSDIEVSPSTAIAQVNDYKIVLQFPRTFTEDEIVLSFKTSKGDCKYIIPVVRSTIPTGGDLLRDLARQRQVSGQEPDAERVIEDEESSIAESSDTTRKQEENKPEAINTIPIGPFLVRIDGKPLIVISDGHNPSYRTSLDSRPKRLRGIAELDNNGVSVSDPTRMKLTYDNDEYIVTVANPKSGDTYTVHVSGRDREGKPVKILITLKYE